MDLDDFPTITMPEAAPVAAPAAPAPAVSAALPAVLSIKDAALAQFSATEATLLALAERHKDVIYDVSVPRQMTAAKLARQEIRDHRYTVQRVEKSTLAELNDLKRDVKSEAERLIGIIDPVEDGVHKQIKAHEDRLAAEKAERERLDAERCARHEANIEAIRAYYTRCSGLPPERVSRGIELLAATQIVADSWEEFHARAIAAKDETLAAMRALLVDLLQRAADEAQRAENERIAAELAEQRRKIDAANAELAERTAAFRAEEARRAALDEVARIEAELAENARLVNLPPPIVVTAPATTFAEDQAAFAAACIADKAVPATVAKLITVKAIGTRLGFALKAAFIEDTLGVPATDGKFNENDFSTICRALIAHIHNLRMQP